MIEGKGKRYFEGIGINRFWIHELLKKIGLKVSRDAFEYEIEPFPKSLGLSSELYILNIYRPQVEGDNGSLLRAFIKDYSPPRDRGGVTLSMDGGKEYYPNELVLREKEFLEKFGLLYGYFGSPANTIVTPLFDGSYHDRVVALYREYENAEHVRKKEIGLVVTGEVKRIVDFIVETNIRLLRDKKHLQGLYEKELLKPLTHEYYFDKVSQYLSDVWLLGFLTEKYGPEDVYNIEHSNLDLREVRVGRDRALKKVFKSPAKKIIEDMITYYSDQSSQTVVNFDTRATNILYEGDGGKVKEFFICDWAGARLAPFAPELTTFLTSNALVAFDFFNVDQQRKLFMEGMAHRQMNLPSQKDLVFVGESKENVEKQLYLAYTGSVIKNVGIAAALSLYYPDMLKSFLDEGPYDNVASYINKQLSLLSELLSIHYPDVKEILDKLMIRERNTHRNQQSLEERVVN